MMAINAVVITAPADCNRTSRQWPLLYAECDSAAVRLKVTRICVDCFERFCDTVASRFTDHAYDTVYIRYDTLCRHCTQLLTAGELVFRSR